MCLWSWIGYCKSDLNGVTAYSKLGLGGYLKILVMIYILVKMIFCGSESLVLDGYCKTDLNGKTA